MNAFWTNFWSNFLANLAVVIALSVAGYVAKGKIAKNLRAFIDQEILDALDIQRQHESSEHVTRKNNESNRTPAA